MSYIGRGLDKISNIEKLDTITFDGSSSYTLQKNSVNFTPNSANSLQVSIDGVVQAGNFSVSSSTIDFGVAIPATSTNDFIFHYGTGVAFTPADGTVSLAKLSATGTKDATTFLRGDNTFAEVPAGGITEADQWRLTTNITSDSNPMVNWERNDNAAFAKIGTGMSESSGIFTFPSTGLYSVKLTAQVAATGGGYAPEIVLEVTQNNSTYVNNSYSSQYSQTGDGSSSIVVGSYVNVTDTSNVKIKYTCNSFSLGGTIRGNTSSNRTWIDFIRLGDSQ